MLQIFYRKSTPFFLLFFVISSFNQINSQTQSRQLENLKAFTKLYGYIRFFHPSDEASQIDWNKFAVYGVEKVKKAKNDVELKEKLKELFYPIAPTMQIYSSNEKPMDLSELLPKDTTGLKIVAWQHLGVFLGGQSKYKSIRLNRREAFSQSASEPDFGLLSMVIKPDNYLGKEIKLRASVKTELNKEFGNGHLWLRVDKENNKMGFFDNMENRPITINQWREYEIVGTVDKNAIRILFGSFLKGYGKLWIDKVQFFYRDSINDWTETKINNWSFEEVENNIPKYWWTGTPGYNYYFDEIEKVDGNQSLVIEKKSSNSIPKLFEKYPKVGEVINEEILPGLFCRIPLALLSNQKSTIGKNDNYPFSSLEQELEKIVSTDLSADDENVRLANVVITWNVLQHFYPYFDVVKVDWKNELVEILKETLYNKNSDDFYITLRKMIAKLEDGHGVVYYQPKNKVGNLPIRAEWIEDNLVITGTKDSLVKKGDVIKKIDGIRSYEVLQKREELISGSLQLRRYRALNEIFDGDLGSDATLEILRGDKTIIVKLNRSSVYSNLFFSDIAEFDLPTIKEIEDSIYYTNLNYITKNDFYNNLSKLEQAKGIIFDWRIGNSRVDVNQQLNIFELLPHLIDTLKYGMKLYIPEIIYPNQQNVNYHLIQHSFNPKSPYLKSQKVFITEPSIVSAGESFISTIEYNKLAELVGETTAGCNGNVNYIQLIGGFQIMFTGMKVLKPDGSQHHLFGIRPNYPVKRTIKAIKEGRDEYLEKAIEVIKSKLSNRGEK